MDNLIETGVTSDECTDPIFILGIMQRCGSNFLKDIVCLHPDCGFPGHPLVEDFLAQNASLLTQYIKSVSVDWNSLGRGPVYDELEVELGHYLGDGAIAFLQSRITQKRLVTKTPSVRDLQHFFTIFPKARLLIVVRDGRAVIESGVKSFGWKYENAFHDWADAAQTILEFDRKHKSSNFKYLIVRYEDVWNNLEEELKKVLLFLNLSLEKFDFEAALNLPIRGSSVASRDSDKVLWKPQEKPKNFNPVERWTSWEQGLHERFNWVAGKYMEEFGYELQQDDKNQWIWDSKNRSLDVQWLLTNKAKKFYRQVKRAFIEERR